LKKEAIEKAIRLIDEGGKMLNEKKT